MKPSSDIHPDLGFTYDKKRLKKKSNIYDHAKLHRKIPDSKVHRAIMRPTWVLSAPDGPHVDPMNLDIRGDDEPGPELPW